MRSHIAGQLLCLLWVSLLVDSVRWEESLENCPPACNKHGNCDHETGECMCLYGYAGRTCEVDVLRACRAGPQGRPTCLLSDYPRNCECYHQCRAVHCNNSLGVCDNAETFNYDLAGRVCYAYDQGHPLYGWSFFPNGTDAGVVWQVYHDRQWQSLPRGNTTTLAAAMEQRPTRSEGLTPVPLHLCPDSCSFNGNCFQKVDGRFQCACFKGLVGKSCEQPQLSACFNNCSGRGSCVHGLCHCSPGHWGADCTRSRAYAPLPFQQLMMTNHTHPQRHQGLSPVRDRLRVYVYELPWTVATRLELESGPVIDSIYRAFEIFYAQLLHLPDVRTENPYEANLYYIPLMSHFYTGNIQPDSGHLRVVVRYVRERFPFWNRTGGRDHVVWLSGDRGGCGTTHIDEAAAPIRIVHFGFLGTHDQLGSRDRGVGPKDRPCVLRAKDVVAPPHVEVKADINIEEVHRRALSGAPPLLPRNTTLFYAGSIRMRNREYSGGARQELHALHQQLISSKDPRAAQLSVVSGQVLNYSHALMTAKFCMAPYGSGWGIRLSQAALCGCVPVIIQDWVAQPLEPLLRYSRFSLRLSSDMVRGAGGLMAALEAVGEEELRRLQRELAKVYRAFLWDTARGGLAFNFTLEALHRSLVNMWTMA